MLTLSSLPLRLLVIERDQAIRELLSDLLQGEGYLVSAAGSLDAAFSLLDEQVFALILANVYVGYSLHSFSAAHLLRRHARPTPVGLLTTLPRSPETLIAQGFAFVSPMPFEVEDLLGLIAATIKSPLTPKQQRRAAVAQRYFAVIAAADQEALVQVCTPDVVYNPSAQEPFTALSRMSGASAYAASVSALMSNMTAFSFDDLLIFAQPLGLAVRYQSSWLGQDERLHRLAGTVFLRFQGERISRIGVRVNTAQLRRHLAG